MYTCTKLDFWALVALALLVVRLGYCRGIDRHQNAGSAVHKPLNGAKQESLTIACFSMSAQVSHWDVNQLTNHQHKIISVTLRSRCAEMPVTRGSSLLGTEGNSRTQGYSHGSASRELLYVRGLWSRDNNICWQHARRNLFSKCNFRLKALGQLLHIRIHGSAGTAGQACTQHSMLVSRRPRQPSMRIGRLCH